MGSIISWLIIGAIIFPFSYAFFVKKRGQSAGSAFLSGIGMVMLYGIVLYGIYNLVFNFETQAIVGSLEIIIAAGLLYLVYSNVAQKHKGNTKNSDSTADYEQELKTCPYCAETIKSEAIVCRYCGRDLEKKESKPKELHEYSEEELMKMNDTDFEKVSDEELERVVLESDSNSKEYAEDPTPITPEVSSNKALAFILGFFLLLGLLVLISLVSN